MPAKLDRCVATLMTRKDMVAKYPDAKVRKSHAFAICNASIQASEGGDRLLPDMLTEDGSFSYAASIELAEGASSAWVHILPIVDVEHPKHGLISITADKIKRFANNVNTKVRGIDPDVDYDHKLDPAKGNKAAGWIKKAEARADGLWGFVEFTPDGADAIRKGEYKYASAEYKDKWKDDKGNSHSDVLFGMALTNRPFMKQLAPINFSELDDETKALGYDDPQMVHLDTMAMSPKNLAAHVWTHHGTSPKTGIGDLYSQHDGFDHADLKGHYHYTENTNTTANDNSSETKYKLNNGGLTLGAELRAIEEGVNMGKLRELLGLKEDATDEDIENKIKSLTELEKTTKPEDDKAKKFAEMFPEEAKALADQKKANEDMARKLAEGEIKAQLNEWHSKGLPPAFDAPITALLLGEETYKLTEDDKEVEKPVTVTTLLNELVGARFVKLKDGATEINVDAGDHPDEVAAARVRKYQEDHKDEKLTFAEAAKAVAAESPETMKDWVRDVPVISSH